jgi:hypothetical protein
VGPRVSGPPCKVRVQDVSVPKGRCASPRLPRLGEGDWRVSTLHRPSVSTDRRTPDRAPQGASVQELLAGNDEQRARAVSSERSDSSSARFSNRPSVHRHGRCSKEHREVRSPRHIHAAANRSTPGRTVGSESLEALYGASEPPRSLRWCQRRRDRGHLGPGSRCPQRGCAASLREGE